MLFARIADASLQVASTSKRLVKIEVIAGLLKQLTPEEAIPGPLSATGILSYRWGIGTIEDTGGFAGLL